MHGSKLSSQLSQEVYGSKFHRQIPARDEFSKILSENKSKSIYVSIPVASVRISKVLSLFETELDYYFRAGNDFASVGLKPGLRIEASLKERELLENKGARFFNKLKELQIGAEKGFKPRFYGGFCFDERKTANDCWKGFGKGFFTISKWTYQSNKNHAFLSFCSENVKTAEIEEYLAEFDEIYNLLSKESTLQSLALSNQEHKLETRSEDSLEEWSTLIEKGLDSIRSKRLEKVVLAREVVLECSNDIKIEKMFESFYQQGPEENHFVFRDKNGFSFLGSSPETLIKKEALTLSTEALAGTSNHEDEHLLGNSKKDLSEQNIVTEEIIEVLSHFCKKVESSNKPVIKRLNHISHLCSKIEGKLKSNLHILEICSKLHPTPAVGGRPSQQAKDFILEHEDLNRGWYAAPVGWFDKNGDGEFIVAIRSALINGKTARIFSGSGIVEGSIAEKEYTETELKQKKMIQALLHG